MIIRTAGTLWFPAGPNSDQVASSLTLVPSEMVKVRKAVLIVTALEAVVSGDSATGSG